MQSFVFPWSSNQSSKMDYMKGLNVLITGASQGIGAEIARAAARESANVILLARSHDKLAALAKEIDAQFTGSSEHGAIYRIVDVQDYAAVEAAVKSVVRHLGPIDILINNAGLALGAPKRFPDLSVADIVTMSNTNVQGVMFTTHAVLNAGGMMKRERGTILNITSTTGLEVPPFPGEAVYHSSKAFQEAFTNGLRAELEKTNIKVLALRPGVVGGTNFHEQRVGFDKEQYDDFMDGFEPLAAKEVAEAAIFMLTTSAKVSVKALDVVPTAQRTLQVIDKSWNERNQVREGEKMARR
jgi:3-hydroxy acid dehydrogenase/malonic semialdehyde reductase